MRRLILSESTVFSQRNLSLIAPAAAKEIVFMALKAVASVVF
jgi:hypothetical protein